MSELSPRASQILEAARRTPRAPSKEAVARMEKAVMVSTGLVAAAAGVKSASLWSSLGTLGATKGVIGVVAITVASAAVTVTVVKRSRATPALAAPVRAAPPPPPTMDPPVETTSAEGPTEVVEALVIPQTVPAPTLAPRKTSAPTLRAPSAPPPAPVPERERVSSPPPLLTASASEVALLRKAKRALDANDAAAALSVLEQHAREFSPGALNLEADVLRVLAWCELGRRDEASVLAARLRESSPRSPALRSLEGSCAE